MKKIGKKSLILAAMVLLLGGAVYVNHVLTENGPSLTDMVNNTTSQSKTLGAAELVNAPTELTETPTEDDRMTQLRLDRTKCRDESISVLKTVTENTALTEEERKSAVDTLAGLVDDMRTENDIETLVKAKGFADCVASVGEETVTVTVRHETPLSPAEAAQIRDIAASTTNIGGDLIKIVEVG